ncbi:HupE/UreJ family protein [Algivirga pacifica]|uniref:HupE/UreJ family protein n=1 Tax=Algivirga pacifica TaxID=1162670 RepID=A0ABP9DNP0_9BACT
MSKFNQYLFVGFEHITQADGVDHVLFVMALIAIYSFSDLKKIFYLVTAFTVGHSITLALVTLKIFSISSEIIEFLIPATIMATCIGNYLHKERRQTPFSKKEFSLSKQLRYFTALFFGLIHGIAFSSQLALESDILIPLLSFNIGLEIGQLLIVLGLIIINVIMIGMLRMKTRDWNMLLTGATGSAALIMLIERWPF